MRKSDMHTDKETQTERHMPNPTPKTTATTPITMTKRSVMQRPFSRSLPILLQSQQLFLLLLLLFSISFLIPSTEASFTVTVPYNDEDCFVARMPKEQRMMISGTYDILDDLNADPVKLVILSEELHILWKSPMGASQGSYSLQQPGAARLYVCVQNGMDDNAGQPARGQVQESRRVGLQVRVRPAAATSSVAGAVADLQNKLWNLKDHHDYMRAREAVHRHVTEETFSQVMRWNLAEAVCVVIISLTQVMYFRRFFEKKRYM